VKSLLSPAGGIKCFRIVMYRMNRFLSKKCCALNLGKLTKISINTNLTMLSPNLNWILNFIYRVSQNELIIRSTEEPCFFNKRRKILFLFWDTLYMEFEIEFGFGFSVVELVHIRIFVNLPHFLDQTYNPPIPRYLTKLQTSINRFYPKMTISFKMENILANYPWYTSQGSTRVLLLTK